MIQVELEKNFYLFHVPKKSRQKFGQNFYVLLKGEMALVIDTGYPSYFKEVLELLNGWGIDIKHVVPSHFHPDHVGGLELLGPVSIYGNLYAEKMLKKFCNRAMYDLKRPTHRLDDDTVLTFGDFTLRFLHAPGHSDCSMLIFINDDYLHVGDLYIATDQGDFVKPYVSQANIDQHIKALELVESYRDKKILLAHGKSPVSNLDVQKRIDYLNVLKQA